jgi:hypothetical protein
MGSRADDRGRRIFLRIGGIFSWKTVGDLLPVHGPCAPSTFAEKPQPVSEASSRVTTSISEIPGYCGI